MGPTTQSVDEMLMSITSLRAEVGVEVEVRVGDGPAVPFDLTPVGRTIEDRQIRDAFAELRRDLFGHPVAELAVVVPLPEHSVAAARTVTWLAASVLSRDGVAFVFVDRTPTGVAAAAAVSAMRTAGLNGTVVSAGPHRGRGGAVRAGVAECRAHYVAVLDGNVDPTLISRAFARMRLSGADVVVGTRHDTSDELALHRRLASRLVRRTAQRAVGHVVEDPQSLVQIYRGTIATEVFARLENDSELFAVEALGKAAADGHLIEQIPVEGALTAGLAAGTRIGAPSAETSDSAGGSLGVWATVRGLRSTRRTIDNYAAAPLRTDERTGRTARDLRSASVA